MRCRGSIWASSLARLVGTGRAIEMILTGRLVDAAEARRAFDALRAPALAERNLTGPVVIDCTKQQWFQARQGKLKFALHGEKLHGVIEWYDKSCLKVNREGEPNLLLYKPNIKYMYKDEQS